MSDPITLMGQIDVDCAELDQIGKDLDTVLEALELAEASYEETFEAELAVLAEEHETKGRLPGEEVRRAIIHKRIDRGLYREVKRLSSLAKRLEARGRRIEKTLSGRQSELSFLKSEGSVPGNVQPSWSRVA